MVAQGWSYCSTCEQQSNDNWICSGLLSPPPMKTLHYFSRLFFLWPPVISCSCRVISTNIHLQVCLVLQLLKFMLQYISSFNIPFDVLFCSTQFWEWEHSFYLWLVRANKKRNPSKNMLCLQLSSCEISLCRVQGWDIFQLLLCLATSLIVGTWCHFFTDSAVSPVVNIKCATTASVTIFITYSGPFQTFMLLGNTSLLLLTEGHGRVWFLLCLLIRMK